MYQENYPDTMQQYLAFKKGGGIYIYIYVCLFSLQCYFLKYSCTLKNISIVSVKKQNSQPKSDLVVITIIKNKVTFQSVSGAVDRKWVGGLFRKHFTVGIQLGAESLITL